MVKIDFLGGGGDGVGGVVVWCTCSWIDLEDLIRSHTTIAAKHLP